MTWTRPTTRLSAALLVLVLGAVTVVSCEPSSPTAATAIDLYSFAGRCHVLKDETTGRFVARDTLGWSAAATRSGATPFRMQATALGRYLLYGTGGQMPQGGPLGVSSTTTPGPRADWRLTVGNGRLGFTNLSNGKGLSVTAAGRLGQSTVTEARWSLVAADGLRRLPRDHGQHRRARRCGAPARPPACAASSTPTPTSAPSSSSAGASTAAGRGAPTASPWPCRTARTTSRTAPAAVAENFFVTGTPVGTHSTDGWPTFDGWPRPESLTHEGTYWKWLERAWRGGLRLVVNDLVENRALCEIYPLKKNDCDEMESVRLQARDMVALQDYIDAQFRGPGKGFFRIVRTPAEARRVINERQARRRPRRGDLRGPRLRHDRRHP